MKYIVMLGDGMADTPVPELRNRTPLEAANKPYMDFIANHGLVGMARTVPHGMTPGSDTANLSVMGYDPQVYYSGRSPLEAVSIGIDLKADDVAFRCNMVTLSDEENIEDATMLDYSAGEITTEEAAELIKALNEAIQVEGLSLYPGFSYRHCLVLNHAQTGTTLRGPHDIPNQPVKEHLPKGRYGELLLDYMKRSRKILADHPVNKARVERGLHPANCCWFWGEGTRPALTPFEELYGIKGGVVAAVDLIKGIGMCAGLACPDIPGATGTVDTNFPGKAQAALKLLEDGCDFVYVHMEAPDECGHRQEIANKVKSIELIDREVLGPIMNALDAKEEPYAILLMPDHPTPLDIRTHTADPVPFVLYRSDKDLGPGVERYTEKLAEATGHFEEKGYTLLAQLVANK